MTVSVFPQKVYLHQSLKTLFVSRRITFYRRNDKGLTTCSVREVKACSLLTRNHFTKLFATRGTNLCLNAPEYVWRSGSTPTHWKSLSAPPDPLAAMGGPTSSREERKWRVGKGKESAGGRRGGMKGEEERVVSRYSRSWYTLSTLYSAAIHLANVTHLFVCSFCF